ncbi:MAG TPA: CHAT domain-containing tetratricopeptide repeat protein [Candidatus Angelobacter sp.]|jgi:tetratricopeptide (TPR) repeat protein|nr:CHAT domain-containing tetratricopeptide repeat protein [Candidatus Angelobacter sp.]
MSQQPNFGVDQWIIDLAGLSEEHQRRDFLATRESIFNGDAVESLYNAVVVFARVDLQKAERMAQASSWIATQINLPAATAQSARAVGHVLYLTGKYQKAILEYEKALAIFQQIGHDVDYARTISGALQSLIYDGQYERAFRLGEEARAIFHKHKDRLRLSRLNSNIANIYFRQDRFQEAVEVYENAYEEFLQYGEPLDIAAVLRNLAVCYYSLNDFDRAEETYLLARQHCLENGFSLLVAEADYNVAYLHYLRGEYLRAIELYDQTRKLCAELGDGYHQALCDLDESEIYLELNLTEGGTELALDAYAAFTELGMTYEAGKAATFSAIAISQQGRYKQAIESFDLARDLFVKEGNPLWPPLIDLYKALVLYQASENDLAEDLALTALSYFGNSVLPSKAALCELLLAALELRGSDPEEARRYCSAALSRLTHIDSPATYQAYFMLGQAEEASGNIELARQAYEQAFKKLEGLRSHLGKEELKIAFLKNKLAVYEGLVVTSLAVSFGVRAQREAFSYIEQAKSRSLADLIAFRTASISSREPREVSPAMGEFRELRQKLNWTYHQIEIEELNPEGSSSDRIHQLRQLSRRYEDALVKAFSQVQSLDREFASLQSAKTVSVEELQEILPENTLLLEYYTARNRFYVCLVSRKQFKIVALSDVNGVREKLRLLQLQLAKFRLGPDYIQPLEKALLDATQAHLEELYALLIAPICEQLTAEHLIIIPHAFLHYLPFHALSDGKRYIIDDFSVSYAPSSSIFAVCQKKPVRTDDGDTLVLAVPDARAPFIEEEAHFVAAAMGNARLFMGEQATEEQLRLHGPGSRFIHIATHGYFRQDNPMFSSIRLGNSLLSLFDLYQLHFDAELVTLSGCGTGMNVVIGGDELIGLVRGLLYAGAQTLMVSLWEVHDQSTAEFMRDFYQSYRSSTNKANALRNAVLKLKEKHRHPYYWAAFALVGKFS